MPVAILQEKNSVNSLRMSGFLLLKTNLRLDQYANKNAITHAITVEMTTGQENTRVHSQYTKMLMTVVNTPNMP